MKITGKQEVKIEISEAQRHLIALDYISEIFEWDTDYFIEDGWVDVDNYTSHHSKYENFYGPGVCSLIGAEFDYDKKTKESFLT